jgi:phosphohistidine phosphatase SixA
MKHLIVIRHGRKDGELIAADQLAEIEVNGIPGLNELVAGKHIIIHYGSEYERTRQTIKAWEKYMDSSSLCHCRAYIVGDKNFGNAEMFAEFMADANIKAEAARSNWYNAFKLHQPAFIEHVQAGMLNALPQIFAQAFEGEIIVMVGHTPMIEWLIYAIDVTGYIRRDTQLKELTGFVINENQGYVGITDTVGFSLTE